MVATIPPKTRRFLGLNYGDSIEVEIIGISPNPELMRLKAQESYLKAKNAPVEGKPVYLNLISSPCNNSNVLENFSSSPGQCI